MIRPERAVLTRILAHPLVLLIVGITMQIVMVASLGQFFQHVYSALPTSRGAALLADCIVAGGSLGMYWLFMRFVERRPFTDFARADGARELALGMAIGAGAMALTVAVIALLGGYRIADIRLPAALIGVLGISIQSAVMEEIVLRGLIFRLTERWLGSWIALAISAALFGALHLGNDNASPFAALAIAVEAGVLLAALYMLTRRLWAVIGLHFAWNFAQGGIFGIAVSGNAMEGVIDPVITGPALLTGGAFGVEASLPAILICTAIGAVCLWLAARRGHFIAPSRARFMGRTGD